MCLILVGWRTHPDFSLIVAANRDEFYARPTAEAARWPDAPRIVGGRDLEAGGTWLGITEGGRFACVTNVREPGRPKGPRSRGALPRDFLLGSMTAEAYIGAIAGEDYSGFNLLACDHESLWYRSNRDESPRALAPGIYAVSNHLLDTPWPKLVSAKTRFAGALAALPEVDAIFGVLADTAIVPDENLPATGVPLEWERLLSAIFVKSETYGTRASTVLTRTMDGTQRLEERRFGPHGAFLGASVLTF